MFHTYMINDDMHFSFDYENSINRIRLFCNFYCMLSYFRKISFVWTFHIYSSILFSIWTAHISRVPDMDWDWMDPDSSLKEKSDPSLIHWNTWIRIQALQNPDLAKMPGSNTLYTSLTYDGDPAPWLYRVQRRFQRGGGFAFPPPTFEKI